MKNTLQILAMMVLLTGCQQAGNLASPKWTSAEKYAEYSTGRYMVRNNVWGENPGSQSIWANSQAQWGVHADHAAVENINGGGVKAYPHAGWAVHKRLSDVPHCTSRFAVTVPATGSYNTAYDIWCEQHAYEIMLWMNWRGKMGPIARSWDAKGTPAVEVIGVIAGGHTWDVYKGTNGSNVVFTFLCTSPTTVGEVDIKAVLDWIKARGWFGQPAGGDVLLDEVQFGWEISSSVGGLDFSVNDFSVDLR